MGSLHVILGDRLNEELIEIYQKTFLYILFHLGREFERQPSNDTEYSTITTDSKLTPKISINLIHRNKDSYQLATLSLEIMQDCWRVRSARSTPTIIFEI